MPTLAIGIPTSKTVGTGNWKLSCIFVRTKTGKVFALLTDYLLQYRKLTIPAIGRFELKAQPARLEFAEKRIHPPAYEIVFSNQNDIDTRLVEFISQRQHLDRQTAEDRLRQMGEKLKEHLASSSFTWAGFGELTRGRDEVLFRPVLEYPLAMPVTAEKVFRENVAHNVLVGDKEFQKTTEVVEANDEKRSFPLYMIISITVLFLALLFILWHFYNNGWKLTGSAWNGFGS